MTKLRANQTEVEEILNDPAAFSTELKRGTVEIATQAEVDAGTDTLRMVSPNTLANFTGLNYNWITANNSTNFSAAPTGTGNDAIAIGRGADTSTAAYAIAIGTLTSASGSRDIVLGLQASSTAIYGIAIGQSAKTIIQDGIAIGRSAYSSGGAGAVSMGFQCFAAAANTISIGFQGRANATSSIAIGDNAKAYQNIQTVIGKDITTLSAATDALYAVKLGYGATVNKNMLYLHDKGKLDLVGDEAQYIFPNYATGSIPATTNEGGAIWDSTTKELKIHNGTAFASIGGVKNPLTANLNVAGYNIIGTSSGNIAVATIDIIGGASAPGSNAGNVNLVGGYAPAGYFGGDITLTPGTGTAGSAYHGDVQIHFGNGTIGQAEVQLWNDTDTGHTTGNYVALKAPTFGSPATNLTLTLPSIDGANGEVLTTDGAGNLSFTASAAGLSAVVDDLTPQLGGDLDLNNKQLFGDLIVQRAGSPTTPHVLNIDTTNGKVAINGLPNESSGALQVTGDIHVEGGVNYRKSDNTVPLATFMGGTNFFVVRDFADVYTVQQIWSPPGAINTGSPTIEREATLALVRGDEPNQEFLDLYNNGYLAETQFGIRMQKRGTGVYRDFVFDYSDGTTKTEVLRLKSDQSATFAGAVTSATSPATVDALTRKDYVDANFVNKAGDTMSGGLSTTTNFTAQRLTVRDPAFPLGGVDFVWDNVGKFAYWNVKDDTGNSLGFSGFNVSGEMYTNPVPTTATSVTNKTYVDDADALKLDLTGGSLTGILTINNTTPQFKLYENDALVDEKYWRFYASGGRLIFDIHNDVNSVATTIFFVERTGITVDSIDIQTVITGTNAPVGSDHLTRKDYVDANDRLTINTQIGTTYTLALADENALVTMSNAAVNTLTIPTNASVAFPIGTQILVSQEGAGTTTITSAGSPPAPTIHSAGNLFDTASQYTTISLIKKATDTWLIVGDLV